MSEYDEAPVEPARSLAPQPTPEQQERKTGYDLDLWYERQKLALARQREDLDILAQPEAVGTMRWRLAYAAEMAQSGLVPRGFRAGAAPDAILNPVQLQRAAASIVLAQEMGEALGVRGAAVFQALQVVEGQVGLKPDYARGRLIEAGYQIEDVEVSNPHGFPVSHTVRVTDPNGKVQAVSYYLGYALRGGMLDSVQLADGTVVNPGQPFAHSEVIGVRARSKQGKALPWESFTHNMLRHGADREYIRRYALHITGGMIPLSAGFNDDDAPVPVRAVAEKLAMPAEVDRPPVDREYDPQADVDYIRERTGSGDWRAHAGATVRRRSRIQMAADRVAAWAAEHPGEAAALEVAEKLAAQTEPVDVEVAGDDPVATQPSGAPNPDDDPGWAPPGKLDPNAVRDKYLRPARRAVRDVELPEPVLLNPEPGVERPRADSEPVAAQEWYADAEDIEPEFAGVDAAYERDRRALLDTVATLAGGEQNLLAYMSGWTNAHGRSPYEATVGELEEFIREQGGGHA